MMSLYFQTPRAQAMNIPSTVQDGESPAEPSLYNLIYCSLAVPNIETGQVEKIIAAAKHHNPLFGITGLLVFGSGIFFQWLEGPKASIQKLMDIIATDPRHSNVVVLSEEDEIRDRLFPDWDMELVEASEISDVLEGALKEASDAKQKQMLAMFLAELKSR
jgi:hypothetical protein